MSTVYTDAKRLATRRSFSSPIVNFLRARVDFILLDQVGARITKEYAIHNYML